MKNFDFIKKLEEEIPAFHQLHAYCDKAEIFQKAFPEDSATNARKALEWLVKNHLAMAKVTLEPHETLSQMLKRPEIDAFVNEDWELIQDMRTVKKIGNYAAHTGTQKIERCFHLPACPLSCSLRFPLPLAGNPRNSSLRCYAHSARLHPGSCG